MPLILVACAILAVDGYFANPDGVYAFTERIVGLWGLVFVFLAWIHAKR